MSPTLTEEQALALIPNNSDLQGRKLAAPGPWTNLGADEVGAWGECQGSGKQPYAVAAGLLERASQCSCPSQDKPCKHVAGLLLLYTRQPELFTAPAPSKLSGWRSLRRQHAGLETWRDQLTDPAVAAAAAARLRKGVDAKRQARMVAGAAELATWLEDLLRQGFARARPAQPGFWEQPARRLVDNQLPGLAADLRELATVASDFGQLLPRLGELYVLVRACQNLPQLAPDLRLDVLQRAGVTFKRENLLAAGPLVADQWLVLHRQESYAYTDRKSTSGEIRRTWLHGRDPGLSSGRATPARLQATTLVPWDAAPAGQGLGQLLADYAAAVARTPWLPPCPVLLAGVLPAGLPNKARCLHHPADNLTVPLLPAGLPTGHHPTALLEETRWQQLLANSAGQPCTVFGEWDGRHLLLLASWPGGAPTPAAPARPADAPRGPAWPPLVQAATVGTDAAPLPALPGLPPAAPAAQQLLLVAGSTALLRKIHFFAPPGAVVITPGLAAPETRPLAAPAALAVLHETLLTTPTALPGLYRLLDDRELRLPPALLGLLLLGRPHDKLPAGLAGQVGTWVAREMNVARQLDLSAPPTPPAPATPAPTQPEQLAQTWALTEPWLTLEQLPGCPPRLAVAFPQKWDPAWEAVGLRPESSVGRPGNGGRRDGALWWLLARLPPRRWAEHFHLSVPELLALTDAHEWGAPLRAAWTEAALAFPDREVTGLLLLHCTGRYAEAADVGTHAPRLLAQLPLAEQLALLTAPDQPPYLLPAVLAALPRPWPAEPAAALLPYLRDALLPGLMPGYTAAGRTFTILHELLSSRAAVPAALLPAYAEALAPLPAAFPDMAPPLGQLLVSIGFQQRLLAALAE